MSAFFIQPHPFFMLSQILRFIIPFAFWLHCCYCLSLLAKGLENLASNTQGVTLSKEYDTDTNNKYRDMNVKVSRSKDSLLCFLDTSEDVDVKLLIMVLDWKYNGSDIYHYYLQWI